MITETYDATVMSIDAEEPNPRGRIKVACVGLLGDEESTLPMWVEPAFDWGWFYVPDIGETVEIEVVSSSEQDEQFGQASIDNLDIHWKGKRQYTDEETDGETEPRPVPEDFKTNYGKRRGFATPNGHIIYFDDTEDAQKIQITWKQGDDFQFITFDETGSIVMSNKNGGFIHLDAENGATTIVDENGNTISSNDKGIKLVDIFKNYIELKDGVIQIVSQANVTVTGADFSAKTGSVNLGDGAIEPAVLGNLLMAYLVGHVHGPPGSPPVPGTPIPVNLILSQTTKVK